MESIKLFVELAAFAFKVMRFDRKKFFDGFRADIDESIEQEQVDGLEFLLGQMEADSLWRDVRHISYALATTGHETAWSFQPVEEGYYLGDKARVKRFQKTLRYYPWIGRGYVQKTWERNYKKSDSEIREQRPEIVKQFEEQTGQTFDVANKPEQSLHPLIAYADLTLGMHQGWYTGKKLSDYISDTGKDYKNARRIINGTDKAALIAGYANKFEDILRASKTSAMGQPTDKPANNPTIDAKIASDTNSSPDNSGTQPPPLNVENVEKMNVAPPQPQPQDTPVQVTTERTSIWAKIGAGFAAVSGLGISLGNMIQSKVEALAPEHFAYVLGGVLLIVLALYFYDRAQARSHAKTIEKMRSAADPSLNTVELIRQ